ncbi:MFS transporter [Staphylococcus gallinarum]|uniref:MFS transporter n=2 Tax=Staphylococcus gallinarum TaxID=1293 RepID=A0ABQ0Y2Q6_STAGA|nr:MFS transporter [Staphylococcus gallinarum]KIR11437.1 multidrug MFS transporter [Staphylococcus gallinarum]MCD8900203.1 MFS transporter [Staphylococcus gallinarum]MCD8903224.1 MFS transporter [Staphylococcus gallinarum]MCD8910558.1 MFS transporter [Staphylococcus gallinarum]MEB6237944.1 MFS transporter [Staphylococcus gallinarum]
MSDRSNLKTPIWTKSFNINFITNFLVYLCMYLLIVIVASYTKEVYHASDSVAGLVSGLFIIGSLIGRFATGKYVNKIGPKRILLIGLAFLLITQLCYFIEGSLSFLMFTRLINGIATGITTTATGTIAAYVTPSERKSEGISLFSLSLVIGAAIGPFFGLLLINSFPIKLLFFICLICGIVSFIISFFVNVKFEITNETLTPTTKRKGFNLSNYIAKEAVPVAIIMLIAGLTYSSILTFLQFFAKEIDLVSLASYFFIFYAIASLITRPIAGRLMDQKTENVVAYPSFILLFLTFLVLSLTHSGWMLVLAGLLLGAGYGNISSCMQAIAIKVSPPTKYGIATSTYFIGLDLGLGFGPYVLGFATSTMTYAQLYGVMAVVVIITLIIYYLVHGRKVKAMESY